MNEAIDIAFIGAKAATRNNEAASLAVHTMSAAYNIAQLAWFRSQCSQLQMSSPSVTQETTSAMSQQYRWEMWKHAVLGGLDVVTLLVKGINGLAGY